MPDSLLFTSGDGIELLDHGGLTAWSGCTAAAIVKSDGAGGGRILCGQSGGGTAGWSMNNAEIGGDIYRTLLGIEPSGGSGDSGTSTNAAVIYPADTWVLVAVTKAAGTTAIRVHRYDGSSWGHVNDSHTFPDGTAIDRAYIGAFEFGGSYFESFRGNILICGFWNTVLSDGTIETLTTLPGWEAAAPLEAWRLNTMSPLVSFGTVGTANETDRTGTSLDTGDAPTWWDETPIEDTEPPTDPAGLTVDVVSSSRIDLDWTASTDNIAVTNYRVERCDGEDCVDFAEIDTSATASYNNTGLAPETLYRYRVRAADAAGNLSGYSSIVEAVTEAASTAFTLRGLMDEMAATLLAVVGPATADTEVQVVGRMNPNPTPPSIDIYPGDPFRDNGTAGFGDVGGELLFTVRARVTTVDNIAGQNLLLRLMDDQDDISVAGTLMEDQTLNGLASSVYVEGNTGYTRYLDGGTESGGLLGCEWRVRVLRVTS